MILANEETDMDTDISASTSRRTKKLSRESETEDIIEQYEEWHMHKMLLNSPAFTCSYTGKSHLTYSEAIESEHDCGIAIADFPNALKSPILFIVQNCTCRGRFEDLLEDIYSFIKNRFFVGEHVEVSTDDNIHYFGIVEHVVSVDSERKLLKSTRKDLPPPSCFQYKIRDNAGIMHCAKYSDIERASDSFSRATLRAFLRTATFVRNLQGERYNVKPSYIEQFVEKSMRWTYFFTKPVPEFPATPMQQVGRPPADPDSGDDEPSSSTSIPKQSVRPKEVDDALADEKLRKRNAKIAAQQEELGVLFAKAAKLGIDNLNRWQQTRKVLSKSAIEQLVLAVSDAQKKEREARQYIKESTTNYHKKRDDLLCDDLKPFPVLPQLPLPRWLSSEDFGRILDITKFFSSFCEFLPIKCYKAGGQITFRDVALAVRSFDFVTSPFTMLVKILLQARSEIAEEEEGDEVDFLRPEHIVPDPNPDYSHPDYGRELVEMTAFHKRIRETFGVPVRHLVMDSLSLTEVLRLVFLTSGYITRPWKHRHRLFQRGSIHFYEDPAFIYRHDHPETIAKLETSSVFDLTPKERLDLLTVLTQQLLSYAKFRDFATERVEEIATLEIQLRKLRSFEAAQELESKDAATLREQTVENQQIEMSPETLRLKQMLYCVENGLSFDADEFDELLRIHLPWHELELEEIISLRKHQKQKLSEDMEHLREIILSNYDKNAVCSFGRDRAFRNYFILGTCNPGCPTMPSLLVVENGGVSDYIGECCQPTPCKNKFPFATDEEWRVGVLACTGKRASCPVHGPSSHRRPQFSFVSDVDQLNKIIDSCNNRGFREHDLADELKFNKQRLLEIVSDTDKRVSNGDLRHFLLSDLEDPALQNSRHSLIDEVVELVLELEQMIWNNRMANNSNRDLWREHFDEHRNVIPFIKEDIIVNDEVIFHKPEPIDLDEIQHLAVAALQLVLSVSVKYLKKPFIEMENNKPVSTNSVFTNWCRSLMECKSACALAMHIFEWESSVQWKNIDVRCRICWRKGDNFIICADCKRQFHMSCVRPRIEEAVPTWLCVSCQPREEEMKYDELMRNMHLSSRHKADGESDIDEDDLIQTLPVVEKRSAKKTISPQADANNTLTPSTPKKKARQAQKRSSIAKLMTEDDQVAVNENENNLPALRYDDEDAPNMSRRSLKRTSSTKPNDVSPTKSQRLSRGLRATNATIHLKFRAAESVLRNAMRQPFAAPFLHPVKEEEAPNYNLIVKTPIDLSTMLRKLKIGEYSDNSEISKDAALLAENCKLYNEPDSDINKQAGQLFAFIDRRLKQLTF